MRALRLDYMLQRSRLSYSPSNIARGASVSACADLTNQLQCCWVDPACAWKKHLTQQL